VPRRSVDPAFVFGVSLAISVVLWFPTLRETMNGEIEITDSGIRYLLALAIAWAGVFGVSSLVAMYASKSCRPSPPTPDSGVRAPLPARRSTDRVEPRSASDREAESARSDAA
jgi:hypothetical protein